MPNLTYNDVLSAYAEYPPPIRPYLLRVETHPTLRATLTKSFMRIIVDIVARAPIADPGRPLAFRADVIATPHAAGLTPDAAEHQAFDTVAQVRELLAGRMPPGAANPHAALRLVRLKRA